MKNKWVVFLIPLGLGVAGIALLIRTFIFDNNVFIPSNFDLIILLIGLSLATFAAVNWIIQEGLEYLKEKSITRARQEAFAEHQRFLRRLDHELKNPITAIRAGIQTLKLSQSTEEQSRLLQILELETQRISRLISDLRKLAEIQNVPIASSPLTVEQIVNDIIAVEKDRIEEQNRLFSVEFFENLPTFLGDHELMLLAIHNLLDNAMKYSRPGDRISLKANAREGYIYIRVSDTGVGVDAAEIPLIWEELYRGKNAQGVPGNGIGLTLVRSIIQLHHGWVNLQSQVGQGTSVTIWIPQLP